MRKALQKWPFDDKVRLAVAPTIPHHCSRRLPARLPRPRQRVRRRPAQPRRRIQGAGGRRLPALRHDADRPYGRARPRRPTASPSRTASGSTTTTWSGSATTAPRSRTIPAATCGSATGSPTCAACSNARSISASAPTARTARTTRTCTRRCGSPPSSPRCRGRNAALAHDRGGAGRPPRAAPARSALATRSAGSRRATRPTSSSSTCTT